MEVSAEVSKYISEVHRKDKAVTWLVAHHENADARNKVVLSAFAEGDFKEMTSHFSKDALMYGLFRAVITYNEHVSVVKFVLTRWIGNDVSPLKKGNASLHLDHLGEIFGPVDQQICAFEVSEAKKKMDSYIDLMERSKPYTT